MEVFNQNGLFGKSYETNANLYKEVEIFYEEVLNYLIHLVENPEKIQFIMYSNISDYYINFFYEEIDEKRDTFLRTKFFPKLYEKYKFYENNKSI
jgi:hypothetical protein